MSKRDRISCFKVQRPVPFNEKAVQALFAKHGYVYAQPKYDGIRGVLFWHEERGQIICVTRENIEVVALTERLKGCQFPIGTAILDCEVVLPEYSFQEASGILRRLSPISENTQVNFHIFDHLAREGSLAEEDIAFACNPSIYEGKTAFLPVQNHLPKNQEALIELYNYYRDVMGYEGIVIKDPTQRYTGGKVAGWYKMKPEETLDGTIVGFVMGTEGKANEGRVVGFSVVLEDGSKTDVTGLTVAQMLEVTENPGLYSGRMIEIKRMQATEGGSSRHPSFVRFRDMDYATGVKA